jgi:hypothetical protein
MNSNSERYNQITMLLILVTIKEGEEPMEQPNFLDINITQVWAQ